MSGPPSSASPDCWRALLGTVGLFGARTGLALGVVAALGRWLGAEGYGRYAYLVSWLRVLLLPSVFGFDKRLLRDIARRRGTGDLGVPRGWLRQARRVSLAIAVALASSFFLVRLGRGDGSVVAACFAAALPLLAVSAVRRGALHGAGLVVRGQIPELVVQPATFLVVVVPWALFDPAGLTLANVAVAFLVSAAVAAWVGEGWLSRTLVDTPPEPVRAWARTGLVLMTLGGLYVLNRQLDIVLLGSMSTPREVGLYAAASRVAGLVGLPLLAVDRVYGHEIGRSFGAAALDEAERLSVAASRVALGAALPIGLIAMVFATEILGWLAPDFAAASVVLAILVPAKLVSCGAGLVGATLVLADRERSAVGGVVLGLMVNVALDLLLIPTWGAVGAAIGAAVSLVVMNIAQSVAVYRGLGLRPGVFGPLLPRPARRVP